MQSASTAYGDAVESDDQLVAIPKVTIGFPVAVQASFQDVSRNVVSITGKRAVTTAFPELATQIAGISTATATVVLAGLLKQNTGVAFDETQSVDWLFRPNDTTSPMYRTPCSGLSITIQEGRWVGGSTPEYVTIFTGTIDDVEVDEGVVTLTCRDQWSTITNDAQLPPVITANPYNAALTSEYAVDYLLRHSSPSQYYTWPARRSSCVLAVGMRSSLWAEVGEFDAQDPGNYLTPTFGPSVLGGSSAYAYALGDGGSVQVPSWTPLPINPGQSITTEFWLSAGNDDFGRGYFDVLVGLSSRASTYPIIDIQVTATAIEVTILTSSGPVTHTWSTTVSFATHYVQVGINWASSSTAVTGVIVLDGTTHSFSLTAANARSTTAVIDQAQLTIAGAGCFEAWQVTTEASGASSNVGFTPTLLLDASLNPLTALPVVSGQSSRAVLSDIATAEAAVVYFDEVGICHFVNRNTIRDTASSLTASSKTNLLSLGTSTQQSMIANHIKVPTKPLSIQPYGIVWQASDKIQVRAGQTYTAVAQINVVNVGTTIVIVPSGAAITDGQSGYRAARNEDGSGGAITNLVMTVTQTSNAEVTISVQNPNGFDVWLVSPQGTTYPDDSDGLPCILVGGQLVVDTSDQIDGTTAVAGGVYADAQWPPLVSGGAASSPDGEIVYTAPDSDWRQDFAAGQQFALDLLSSMYAARPLYRNVVTVADGRRQLLDVETFTDLDVSQVDDDALILGIQFEYSTTGWKHTLDALALAPPGAWLLGVAGRSEFNTTTYLY